MSRLHQIFWQRLQRAENKVSHIDDVVGTEIKPLKKVKVIKIYASMWNKCCNDMCNYKIRNGKKYCVGIGSTACQFCNHYNKQMSDANKDIVVCGKYTERQAKRQNLKYIVV